MRLAYDVAGSGPAVVLVHSGVTDRRMWDEQVALLAPRFTVVRCDLRGFGDSPLPPGPFSNVDDLAGVFDAAGIERAALVGNSLGGRVALEFALEHPGRVTKLVLIGAGLPDHEWSEEVRRFGDEEDALVEAGDLDAAVELNLRMWGMPHVHDRLRPMQRRAFEIQVPAFAGDRPPGPDRKLDPPASARLGELAVPTLVVVGEHDLADAQAIARRLADGIPGARLETIAGAKHFPSLERPDEFNRLLLKFLHDGV